MWVFGLTKAILSYNPISGSLFNLPQTNTGRTRPHLLVQNEPQCSAAGSRIRGRPQHRTRSRVGLRSGTRVRVRVRLGTRVGITDVDQWWSHFVK